METKAGMFDDALRKTEQGKINCAKAHFEAVSDEVKYFKADSYNEVTKHF